MSETVGNSETLTEEGLADVYANLLSAEPEYQENSETPPTQESPESEPKSEEEPVSEPGTDEGESEETEQTEETETEESPAAQLDPNLPVKVKIDGVEQEITLGEALRGYSRQQDYTRKTQELASHRKEMEQVQVALRGDRERYATMLAQLEQAHQESAPKEPDWDTLRQESPAVFAEEWARWSQYKERMAELKQARERAEQAVLQDRQESFKKLVTEAREKLVELIPEWKDTEKAKAEKAKMISTAQEEYGYSEDELRQVIDPRIMRVLRDATLYRELQKKKPAISATITKVKAATPGPSGATRPQQTKAAQAKARLAKSGSLDDFAALLVETGNAD